MHEDLEDALMELSVTDGGKINRGKLGWYLRQRVGQVADGLTVSPGPDSRRTTWVVRPA